MGGLNSLGARYINDMIFWGGMWILMGDVWSF